MDDGNEGDETTRCPDCMRLEAYEKLGLSLNLAVNALEGKLEALTQALQQVVSTVARTLRQ